MQQLWIPSGISFEYFSLGRPLNFSRLGSYNLELISLNAKACTDFNSVLQMRKLRLKALLPTLHQHQFWWCWPLWFYLFKIISLENMKCFMFLPHKLVAKPILKERSLFHKDWKLYVAVEKKDVERGSVIKRAFFSDKFLIRWFVIS